jgi:hypothetical protein
VSGFRRAIRKVGRHWRDKGPAATFRAIAETLLRPMIRRRQRMVYDIDLTSPRAPSEWGPGEQLLIFGRDNIGELGAEMLETLEP